MKQEGPKLIEIPAQSFMSCYGCDFFKQKLVVSGRDPQYSANCHHPEFKGGKPNEFHGNLSRGKDDHIIAPKGLCPFLKVDNNSGGTSGHGTSGHFLSTQFNEHGTFH